MRCWAFPRLALTRTTYSKRTPCCLGAARGYADVFKRNHFAWDLKNLDSALKQLLTYSPSRQSALASGL